MATTEARGTVVCDAGPLIHLDESGCVDLLGDFGRIIVPDAVWAEVERHRPGALAAPTLHLERRACASPCAEIEALTALFTLHRGETEALALAREIGGATLLTDDTAARLAARSLGIAVHGSIGVLIRAIRRRRRSKAEVVALLRGLPRKTSLFIRPSLLEEIVAEVERDAE